MASFYDKMLKEDHDKAKEDFEHGEEKFGKEEDDRIGAIHDMLYDLWKEHHEGKISAKEEHKEDSEVADVKLDDDKEKEKEEKEKKDND